jgi:hypothetical protein
MKTNSQIQKINNYCTLKYYLKHNRINTLKDKTIKFNNNFFLKNTLTNTTPYFFESNINSPFIISNIGFSLIRNFTVYNNIFSKNILFKKKKKYFFFLLPINMQTYDMTLKTI